MNAPELAARVTDQQLQDLAALESDRRSDLSRSNYSPSCADRPALNAGQVLERYREHPYAKYLERLAARELLISDRAALAGQLLGTLERLIAEELHRQRYEPLIEGGAADTAGRTIVYIFQSLTLPIWQAAIRPIELPAFLWRLLRCRRRALT